MHKMYKILITTLLVNSLIGGMASEASAGHDPDNQPRQGFPGRRIGGGTRSNCAYQAQGLMALVPDSNLSLTAAARPTLFFRLPDTDAEYTAEFVLRDSEDETVYEAALPLAAGSSESGMRVVGLDLSALPDFEPLQPGEDYHWYFSIICNPADRAEDIVVNSWLRRVDASPALLASLSEASAIRQTQLYLEAGLWPDALNALVGAPSSHRFNGEAQRMWEQLLQSIGLNAVADFPVADVQMLGDTDMSVLFTP